MGMLLGNEIYPNIGESKDGYTLLRSAIEGSCLGIASFLLAHRAVDLNWINARSGRSQLLFAVENGRIRW